MKFNEFWLPLSRAEREAFATAVGSTPGYLMLVSSGHARPGESLAINIERESERKVCVEETRPDVDWAVVRGTGSQAAA